MNHNIVIRIPADLKDDFLSVLESEGTKGNLQIRRVRTYRSAQTLVADILLTLLSTGSLAALAAIIKTWLERKRGVIEVISEKKGTKILFQGSLDLLPVKELQKLIEEPPDTELE
jgi:hypothetical protein